jgi:predicted HTH transcriptional regulator
MTMLDYAAALIRRRLDELSAERVELERALRGLDRADNGGRAGPRRSTAPKKQRRRARGRGKGPTRKQQVLAQVKANPAIRTSEIAAALRISTNQVSNLLRELKNEGALRQDGRTKKWVVRT